VSDEGGQENTPTLQALGIMLLRLPPQTKRLPTLAKSPLQAALQEAHSQEENRAGFKFYPVLQRPGPNNPSMKQRFHEKITFKTLKGVKQSCIMALQHHLCWGYHRVW
jgi:hypothetical protein